MCSTNNPKHPLTFPKMCGRCVKEGMFVPKKKKPAPVAVTIAVDVVVSEQSDSKILTLLPGVSALASVDIATAPVTVDVKDVAVKER